GETDVDCGGPNCTTKCATGKACSDNPDCATDPCVDGHCGCTPGAHADGDGMDDCAEYTDGDPRTGRKLFNGVHVRYTQQCTDAPSCSGQDTVSEVDTCLSAHAIVETKDQYAGWDHPDGPDNICSATYGFKPNWTACSGTASTRWQVDWQGFI